MQTQKIIDLYDDLIAMAKKHNLFLIMGVQGDSDIEHHFDGFTIFITDGNQSPKKELALKSGILEASNSTYIKVKKVKRNHESS